MSVLLSPDFNPNKHPIEITTLSFFDAIKEVIKGKMIRRISWPEKDLGFLENGILTIRREDTFHQWILNDGDLTSTDWIVIE